MRITEIQTSKLSSKQKTKQKKKENLIKYLKYKAKKKKKVWYS